LYFGSNRPGGFVKTNLKDDWGLGVDGTPTRYDMYVSRRENVNEPWGKPSLLPESVNSIYNDHSARHNLAMATTCFLLVTDQEVVAI